MNYSFPIFGVTMLLVIFALGYFLRGAIFSITDTAAQHAKTYAVAYVKGGALVYIAATAAFESAYWASDEGFRSSVAWAPFVIFFNKPISGGLAVLVAFLDRSTQRAGEEAKLALPAPSQPLPSPAPAALPVVPAIPPASP